MTDKEIDRLLTQDSSIIKIENGSILEYHTTTFAANEPIEDRTAFLSTSKSLDHMFGVYDGHGGHAAAQFAKEQLFHYIQYNLYQKLQLQQAFEKTDPEIYKMILQFQSYAQWEEMEKQLSGTEEARNAMKAIRESFDATRAVPDAMKKAFQQADQAFLLAGVVDKANRLQDVFSGACLLLSYIVDNLIFVANAGDSKAVFGQKIKDAAGNDCWGVIPLSSPHTADTEAELIRSQHPTEADAVFQGRIKGYLEPSRGLGDALFKDKYFNKCLMPEAQLPEPFSPPYTTAIPDVSVHEIACREAKDSFAILASDGLWDVVSNEEAVDIVAKSIAAGENAATNLLKKSLETMTVDGDTLTDKVKNCLQLPAKIRRHFYDDTSITVIFFQPNTNKSTTLPRIPLQDSSPPTSFVTITEKLQGYLPPHNSSPT